MKVDLTKPVFYAQTGRPVEILEVVPVVKHRVRFSNGNEQVFGEDDIDRLLTNEKPKYKFDLNIAAGLEITGAENRVVIRQSRPFGSNSDMRRSLDINQVRDVAEKLALWVQDRE